MKNINVKQTTIHDNSSLEIPTDAYEKERLMKYHRVDNDRDLKLELYRDMLRKKRNASHKSSNI